MMQKFAGDAVRLERIIEKYPTASGQYLLRMFQSPGWSDPLFMVPELKADQDKMSASSKEEKNRPPKILQVISKTTGGAMVSATVGIGAIPVAGGMGSGMGGVGFGKGGAKRMTDLGTTSASSPQPGNASASSPIPKHMGTYGKGPIDGDNDTAAPADIPVPGVAPGVAGNMAGNIKRARADEDSSRNGGENGHGGSEQNGGGKNGGQEGDGETVSRKRSKNDSGAGSGSDVRRLSDGDERRPSGERR